MGKEKRGGRVGKGGISEEDEKREGGGREARKKTIRSVQFVPRENVRDNICDKT